ncbi:MAG: YwiC-like family protein [Bryobacterales bacterium]|nr:YwiC-like family protein [Bryobacterales bacterium]
MTKRGLLLPREHGAWGMLLQPFAAAAIIGRSWSWLLAVSLLAVLIVFAMREPLLVLARQRWVWREPHPETEAARRTLWWELPVLAGCGLLLLRRVSLPWMAGLGGMALLLTAAALWMTLKNRQRSVLLQLVSAAGLSASSLLVGYLAAGSMTAPWIWWVWILHALHSQSGIFAVHARLDAMGAQRNPEKLGKQAQKAASHAWRLEAVNAAIGAALAVLAGWVAVPVFLSVLIHVQSLLRLRKPEALKEPLRKVGQRALAASIVHSLVIILVLWQPAGTAVPRPL